MPDALEAALAAEPATRAVFERMSPSHQQEYITWIAEAKREATRARRAAKALVMIREYGVERGWSGEPGA